LLLGLGIENKDSTVFFIFALTIGLVINLRWLLRSKWFWVALGIVILCAAPNFIWQVRHGFPTYIDLSNVRATHKNVELPPPAFLLQQVMRLNPFSLLLWGAGLGFFLFGKEGKPYRVLGVTYLVFLVVMMGLKAKDYYLTPVYPMLFAAGGVFWESFTRRRRGNIRVRV
jgi:4-amino-4-deoxy-L-arabinose transferase-like glycosyltransferase